MYDDVDVGVFGCHGHGSAAEDGDLRDALVEEHLMKAGRADEAGCAGEDEMHA